MTNDDLKYEIIKQAPHPENFPYSFGYKIANELNLPIVCQASSGSSIERSIRTTKQFIYQTNQKVFVLLGLPAVTREEWYYQNKWWQITPGPANRYPKELEERFKKWLINYNSKNYVDNRINIVSKKVQQFTDWLDSLQINYLIFTTVDDLLGLQNYTTYLISQKIMPDKWNHFKEDGHQKWAEYLIPQINDIICKR